MRKLHTFILTTALLILLVSSTVFADVVAGDSPGGGGGGGGSKPPTGDEHYCLCLPIDVDTYKPRVTLIHNGNALAHAFNQRRSRGTGGKDNDPVYWIPTTADLPFDLKTYIESDVTTPEGNVGGKPVDVTKSNSFAIVYDGYFDSEAAVNDYYLSNDAIPKSDLTSVTNTFTATGGIADPALKKLGYDLLLINENYQLNFVEGVGIDLKNSNTVAGVTPLTVKQAVMDIYKAVGIYEYKIDVAFQRDNKWETNKMPILDHIQTLTNGIDNSASYCLVAVSRTVPDLYWDKFLNDSVMLQPIESDTTGSQIVHCGPIGDADSTISAIDFCKVLVSLMNLYGESTLAEDEVNEMKSAYVTRLYDTQGLSDEEQTIVNYLLTKGIFAPEDLKDIQWNGTVSLLSEYNGEQTNSLPILTILGRVCDPERRLKISKPKRTAEIAALADAGYVKTDVTLNSTVSGLTVHNTADVLYYDYFVEVPPKGRRVTAKKSYDANSAPDPAPEPEPVPGSPPAPVPVPTTESEYDAFSFANVKLGETVLTCKASTGKVELDVSESADSDGNVPIFPFSTTNDVAQACYYGTTTFNGTLCYHFKILRTLVDSNPAATITIYYDVERAKNNGEVVNSNSLGYGTIEIPNVYIVQDGVKPDTHCWPEELTMDSSKAKTDVQTIRGGYYSLRDPDEDELKYNYTSFKEFADCGNYIDSYHALADKSNGIRLSNSKAYTVTFQASYNSKAERKEAVKNDVEHGLLYKDAVKKPKTLQTGSNNNTVIAYRVAKSNTYYFVCTVDNTNDVLDSTIFKHNGVSDVGITEGYLRKGKDNNSLLMSVKSLKNAGIISIFKKINDSTYIMTSSAGTTVTIDTKSNYMIIGNYLVTNKHNEVLYYPSGSEYVNVKALMGWGGNLSVYATNSDDVVACPVGIYDGSPSSNIQKLSSKDNLSNTVSIYYLSAGAGNSNNYLNSKYKTTYLGKTNDSKIKGLPFVADYALANYLLVENPEPTAGADFLFVWRLKDELKDDKVHGVAGGDDFEKNPYQLFKNLTGSSLPKQTAYSLQAYCLYYNGTNLPKGFKLAQEKYAGGAVTLNSGWYYDPQPVDKYTEYVQGKGDYPMSIFKGSTETKFWDVNVNRYKVADSIEEWGKVIVNATSNNARKWTMSGNNFSTTNIATPDMDTVKVLTAPVGIWANLYKKYNCTAIKSLTNTDTVFYGTQRCTIKNGSVVLGSLELTLPANTLVVRTTYSSPVSYVILADTSNLKDFVADKLNELDTSVSDPQSVVDWGQYKFDRLTKHLDAWSTVVLIFILNILPRVCLLFFFILMLFSLIANVKPWRLFCQYVFDVYSLLTLGHQNVNTIDTKRTLFVSLVCFSLFLMIMDGQLFNFMIFIAKFVIALYQR